MLFVSTVGRTEGGGQRGGISSWAGPEAVERQAAGVMMGCRAQRRR